MTCSHLLIGYLISWSDGFFWCTLIWIFTVCKDRTYLDSARQGLISAYIIPRFTSVFHMIIFRHLHRRHWILHGNSNEKRPEKPQISLWIFSFWPKKPLFVLWIVLDPQRALTDITKCCSHMPPSWNSHHVDWSNVDCKV